MANFTETNHNQPVIILETQGTSRESDTISAIYTSSSKTIYSSDELTPKKITSHGTVENMLYENTKTRPTPMVSSTRPPSLLDSSESGRSVHLSSGLNANGDQTQSINSLSQMSLQASFSSHSTINIAADSDAYSSDFPSHSAVRAPYGFINMVIESIESTTNGINSFMRYDFPRDLLHLTTALQTPNVAFTEEFLSTLMESLSVSPTLSDKTGVFHLTNYDSGTETSLSSGVQIVPFSITLQPDPSSIKKMLPDSIKGQLFHSISSTITTGDNQRAIVAIDPSGVDIRTDSAPREHGDLQTTTTPRSTSGANGSSLCWCPCASFLPEDLTSEEMEVIVQEIVREIKVDKKNLSSTQRKYISVSDERRSAQSIGTIGVVLLCAIFGGIAAWDFITICRNAWRMCTEGSRPPIEMLRKQRTERIFQEAFSVSGESKLPNRKKFFDTN